MKPTPHSTFQLVAAIATLAATATLGVEAFAPAATTTPIVGCSAAAAAAAVIPTRGAALLAAKSALNLPGLEELSTAPFMKQVQYGSELAIALKAVTSVNDDDDDERAAAHETVKASLEAQLSHPDGIRGFMVAYLTGIDDDDSNSNDIRDETDPELLLETLHGLLLPSSSSSADDQNELVSLMCMNAVMPVAMITMHSDPALSEASRMTAARGCRLLASVSESSPSIRSNARAIAEAAATTTSGGGDASADPKLVGYWKEFFGKWGYEEAQTNDIAATMNELLSSSSS